MEPHPITSSGTGPNERTSNGYLNKGGTANATNGHLTNGSLSNGHLPNGRLPNKNLPNERLSNERITNGRLPNGILPNGGASQSSESGYEEIEDSGSSRERQRSSLPQRTRAPEADSESDWFTPSSVPPSRFSSDSEEPLPSYHSFDGPCPLGHQNREKWPHPYLCGCTCTECPNCEPPMHERFRAGMLNGPRRKHFPPPLANDNVRPLPAAPYRCTEQIPWNVRRREWKDQYPNDRRSPANPYQKQIWRCRAANCDGVVGRVWVCEDHIDDSKKL